MMSFSYHAKLSKKPNKCTYRPIWSEFCADPIKVISIILILLLSACTRVEPPLPTINFGNYKFELNGDTVVVDEIRWKTAGLGNYPFLTGGDLSCSNNSVEFYPDSLHEQDIGLPLNQIARDNFKQDNLTSNVPYSIKPHADLSQAVRLGLMICDFNKQRMK